MDSAHANMRLIDTDASRLLGKSLVLENILLLWVPEAAIEKFCVVILDKIACPCWIFIGKFSVRLSNLNFVLLPMLNQWSAILIGLEQACPHTKLVS